MNRNEDDEPGPLACSIVRQVLRRIGHQEPTKHSQFRELAELAQNEIDDCAWSPTEAVSIFNQRDVTNLLIANTFWGSILVLVGLRSLYFRLVERKAARMTSNYIEYQRFCADARLRAAQQDFEKAVSTPD